MDKVDISIIMGAYNEEERWVRKCIESILNQTFKNFEFIIILDNPNNIDLKNLIEDYAKKDSRIRFYVNEKNLGLVNTLNKGIGLATGKYIARMDADDISVETRLEKQFNFLEKNKNISMIGTNIICINEEDNIIEESTDIVTDKDLIKEISRYRNCMVHPSMMFKREDIIKIGNYRHVLYAEDYDLVSRFITSGYSISNINEVLLKYRVRKTSVTNTNKKNQILSSLYISEMHEMRLRGEDDKFSLEELKRRIENDNTKLHALADKLYTSGMDLHPNGNSLLRKLYFLSSVILDEKYKKIFNINKKANNLLNN